MRAQLKFCLFKIIEVKNRPLYLSLLAIVLAAVLVAIGFNDDALTGETNNAAGQGAGSKYSYSECRKMPELL